MKNIYILFIALLGSLSMTSCFEEEFDSPVMNTSPEFDMTASSNDVVLMKDNVGMTALELTWNAPDYGVQSANPAYQIKFNGVTVSEVVGETELVLETEELNAFLLENEFEPDVAQTATVQISAKLGTSFYTDSSTQEIQFTAYADQLDLTTTWGLVGSATPNGWDGPDVPFYKTEVENVLVAYADLVDGEIKIRENNEWTTNYGDNEAEGSEVTTKSGTLELNGGNIQMAAGSYKIEWNTQTLEYSIQPYTWGLVGSATENGWDGPDMPLTYDSTTDTWKAYVDLVDGEIKVRKNNDWGLNYGDTSVDGYLDEGGDNIAVTAGTYYIQVNFKTFEFLIEKVGTWGLVGSATANGWDGPDQRFMKDFSKNNAWYLNDVTLVDGEIKVRRNNDWGLNYGDTGSDGILDEGGDNIVVTAGTYDFYVDFEGPDGITFTVTKK